MSVSLNPNNSLGFKRPLTQLVKRTLTISNHNTQPIAFKVKTTAPKLYCVRPNSGRVDPGESIDVSVMLQPMKEDPPLNAKCKDKFLIQSTLITPEKETMAQHDIWAIPDGNDEAKVHQQKLRVTYLPAEGQALEEEDEGPGQANNAVPADPSRLGAVRQHPIGNGHPEPMPEFEPPAQEPHRPNTPGGDFIVAREDSLEEPAYNGISLPGRDAHAPPSPSPPAAPELTPEPTLVTHAPVEEYPQDPDLVAKFNQAQAEIERLRATLAAMSVAPPTELRRRNRALSDDGSIAETDVATMIDDGPLHQEGVPLQVVVIIALGVFITTYLFF